MLQYVLHLIESVISGFEVIITFSQRVYITYVSYVIPYGFKCPCFCLSQMHLEFPERDLDWIEVLAVWCQEEAATPLVDAAALALSLL